MAATSRKPSPPCPLPRLTPEQAVQRWRFAERVELKKAVWIPSLQRTERPPQVLFVDGVNADWLKAYGYAERVTREAVETRNVLDVSRDRWIASNNAGPGEWFWEALVFADGLLTPTGN